VRRKLLVALLSTGDEVREPGEPLRRGQIHDANRYILAGCSSAWVSRCRITASSRRSGELAMRCARPRRDDLSSPRAASRPRGGPCPHRVANNGRSISGAGDQAGRPVAMARSAQRPWPVCPAIRRPLLTFALVARPMIEALVLATPHVAQRFGSSPTRLQEARGRANMPGVARAHGMGLASPALSQGRAECDLSDRDRWLGRAGGSRHQARTRHQVDSLPTVS